MIGQAQAGGELRKYDWSLVRLGQREGAENVIGLAEGGEVRVLGTSGVNL